MNIRLTCLLVVLNLGSQAAAQSIILDASQTLNEHADKNGIWVNTSRDNYSPELVKAIRDLRIKSVRYGWRNGSFDFKDLSSQVQSPQDQLADGCLANGKGRIFELFGPSKIAELLTATRSVGFAVLNTDGINYTGSVDERLASLSAEQRVNHYSANAAIWATWAKDNPFQFFEIGNENDLTGQGESGKVIAAWEPKEYARVARAYIAAIKQANPKVKCGINGGLRTPVENERWFREIAEAQPTLAKSLDFIVAHKYEMELSYDDWSKHADWDFGRLTPDFRKSHARHFANLPIQVTEIGSWKTGENDQHYRALIATEMLGNLRMDSAVEYAHFWPTRWQSEGGVFRPKSLQLSSMGLGMLTYTQFAHPVMFSNGFNGSVRYFAAKGKNEATVWFVNHESAKQNINCRIKNTDAPATNEQWSLRSPSNSPTANDTTLNQLESVKTISVNRTLTFNIQCEPLSVTVISFSANVSNAR